jgi:hypothetical protein
LYSLYSVLFCFVFCLSIPSSLKRVGSLLAVRSLFEGLESLPSGYEFHFLSDMTGVANDAALQ